MMSSLIEPWQAVAARRGAQASRTSPAELVSQALAIAGCDKQNLNSSTWNPLRHFIQPGQTVLLKPNLVKETHPRFGSSLSALITCRELIEVVTGFTARALSGTGKIIIADAPQTDSSFDSLRRALNLDELEGRFSTSALSLEIRDLRKEEWVSREGVIVNRKALRGDVEGYVAFDLNKRSEFVGHRGEGRYYGADYASDVVNLHHSSGKHEYLIAGTAIKADVLISLPKLKTHKKAGITAALKNLIGVNGDKNWLPHHTEGHHRNGGDERPVLSIRSTAERALVRQARSLSECVPGLGTTMHQMLRRGGTRVFGDTEEIVRSGNWWGNDTIWRTCLDLNKVVAYGNSDGTVRADRPSNRKTHLVFVDAFVAGEGNGPMNPEPVEMGTIIFGTNPATVDAACAVLMGFDPERIPIVRQAFLCAQLPLAEWGLKEVELLSNEPAWNGRLENISPEATCRFRPHFGWSGRIERSSETCSTR